METKNIRIQLADSSYAELKRVDSVVKIDYDFKFVSSVCLDNNGICVKLTTTRTSHGKITSRVTIVDNDGYSIAILSRFIHYRNGHITARTKRAIGKFHHERLELLECSVSDVLSHLLGLVRSTHV